MRIYLFLCFCLFLLLNSCNPRTESNKKQQEYKENVIPLFKKNTVDSLHEVISSFVKAYKKRSNEKVNELLHPDLGLKIVYRPGVSDTFVEVKAINFDNPVPTYYDYPVISSDFILEYASLPKYDCATEHWDKLGLYCDTSTRPTLLSSIISFENQYSSNKFNKDSELRIQEFEKNSYRVILTSENPLVFHVQKYEGAWYVVVLDRAYAGCDA